MWWSPARAASWWTASRLSSSSWDTVRVAPEGVRAFEAGPDGLDVIAVGGPKPEGGDGEQVPAEWPD